MRHVARVGRFHINVFKQFYSRRHEERLITQTLLVKQEHGALHSASVHVTPPHSNLVHHDAPRCTLLQIHILRKNLKMAEFSRI